MTYNLERRSIELTKLLAYCTFYFPYPAFYVSLPKVLEGEESHFKALFGLVGIEKIEKGTDLL